MSLDWQYENWLETEYNRLVEEGYTEEEAEDYLQLAVEGMKVEDLDEEEE